MEPPVAVDMLDFIKNNHVYYGFVCNDAGGASDLVSLINNEVKSKPSFSLATGPATKIVSHSKISVGVPIARNMLEQNLKKTDLLITSTGWMTNLEKDAVSLANSMSVPTLSVIDHWVNYRERFGPKNTDLPMHIAVNNLVAFDFCKRIFPQINISIFMDHQLEYYRRYLASRPPVSNKCILVVLDAMTKVSFTRLEPLLQDFLKLLERISKNMNLKLLFRLHPAQKLIDNIDLTSVLNHFKTHEISHNTLEQDLHRAEIVVGIDSKVLYYSSELNLPTFYASYNSDGSWLKSFTRIQKLEVLL